MFRRTLSLARVLVLSTLATACGGSAAPRAPLPSVSATVLERGRPIYLGRVFPLEGRATAPTFVYERRVEERAGDLVSTHVTRDSSGTVVLAESAMHSRNYALESYTLHANQLAQTGDVRVSGGVVRFRLKDGATWRTAEESVTDPVVVGPTLVGHVMRHLPDLRRGSKSSVRFAVLDRLETIGFELETAPAAPGQTRVVMKPSSFVYGLAIDPVTFTFETGSRKLVRLEGRVPPKRPFGDELRDFDARVEYAFLAPSYL